MSKRRKSSQSAPCELGNVLWLKVPVVRLDDTVSVISYPVGTLTIDGHGDLEIGVAQTGGYLVTVRALGGGRVIGRYLLKATAFVPPLVERLFRIKIPVPPEVTE